MQARSPAMGAATVPSGCWVLGQWRRRPLRDALLVHRTPVNLRQRDIIPVFGLSLVAGLRPHRHCISCTAKRAFCGVRNVSLLSVKPLPAQMSGPSSSLHFVCLETHLLRATECSSLVGRPATCDFAAPRGDHAFRAPRNAPSVRHPVGDMQASCEDGILQTCR